MKTNNLKIYKNHSIDEYRIKYGRYFDKGYVFCYQTLEEAKYINRYRKRKLWEIDKKYYEIPLIRTRSIVLISILALILLAACPTYLFAIQTFNVEFETHNCKVIGNNKVKRNRAYNASFEIDYGYELTNNDIEVSINNNVNNNCWTFMYQSNLINSFKISPNIIKGNVKVKINPTKRALKEYGCAVDVDAVDQSSIQFRPTQKEFKYISDWQRNAFAINEDEKLDFIFKAKEGNTLPTNIGMWMNGRYAKEGVEVFFTYSSDKSSCNVIVPYFVTKDNLQFRSK